MNREDKAFLALFIWCLALGIKMDILLLENVFFTIAAYTGILFIFSNKKEE